MNEFLSELATLGLGAGALTLLGTCAYRIQQFLRQRFARKRDDRKRQFLQLLLVIACGGVAVVLAPVIDAPRRPLFDYVGIVLAIAAIAGAATLALDLLAGLQLRLRGALHHGAWICAGDYVGQVSRRGALQVVLLTSDGESVHLPNRYLAQVPIHLLAGEGSADQALRLAHIRTTALAAPEHVHNHDHNTGVAPTEASVPVRPGIAERREPVLMPNEEPEAAEPVSKPAVPDIAVVPALDPATMTELRQLKNDYTELSQQLLDIERALQAAGQGEERQPLSLEKKKLEARLARLDKQIVQLEEGERRRA